MKTKLSSEYKGDKICKQLIFNLNSISQSRFSSLYTPNITPRQTSATQQYNFAKPQKRRKQKLRRNLKKKPIQMTQNCKSQTIPVLKDPFYTITLHQDFRKERILHSAQNLYRTQPKPLTGSPRLHRKSQQPSNLEVQGKLVTNHYIAAQIDNQNRIQPIRMKERIRILPEINTERHEVGCNYAPSRDNSADYTPRTPTVKVRIKRFSDW